MTTKRVLTAREILQVAHEAGYMGEPTPSAVRSCAAALAHYRKAPGDVGKIEYGLEGMAAARTVIGPGLPGWIPAQQKLGMAIRDALLARYEV